MTYSVYQHWDPLKVCVVGRSYPPEFYSWITVPHVRSLLERMAQETEEDYLAIIKKLEEFDVKVLRPTIPDDPLLLKDQIGRWVVPPMTPRDYTLMIGNHYYHNPTGLKEFYNRVRDVSWPDCDDWDQWHRLPQRIKDECVNVHGMNHAHFLPSKAYENILNEVKLHCKVTETPIELTPNLNGAMVSRIGRDLYFGTHSYDQPSEEILNWANNNLGEYRNHVVNTGGHSDGTYCPVCPGLIISNYDIKTYESTYPGWEVVYLDKRNWAEIKNFAELKRKNNGRWWIPGFEHDDEVVNVVDSWLGHWLGYVEETVFDVNMLMIDPKNVIVFSYNKQVFDAFDRYGITPHIVPFRHRFFWDGGIHCITSDLHREGTVQDYFPERG